MMKQFYQLVSKLFARTLPKRENPLLLSGDHLIPTFTSQNTTHTSFKKLEEIISTYNIGQIEKIDEIYGVSILIIDGAPWACESSLADELEDYINEQKRSEKRTQ